MAIKQDNFHYKLSSVMYVNPEYEHGNFYRKNKYAQQYNLPDSAWRNRYRQNNITQFPQGCSYFPTTGKKHFTNNFHQRSEIKQSSLLDEGVRIPKQHNNLDTHDIQGAVPNTIISLAVKNRNKSEQYTKKSRMKGQIETKNFNHINLQNFQEQLLQQRKKLANMKMFWENYHITERRETINRDNSPKSKLALINDTVHQTISIKQHNFDEDQNKLRFGMIGNPDSNFNTQKKSRYSNNATQQKYTVKEQSIQRYEGGNIKSTKNGRIKTEQPSADYHPAYIPRQHIRKLNPTYFSHISFINQSSSGKLFPNIY